MYTEADVKAVDAEMYRQLKATAEAIIDASYYCAYHPAGVVPEYTREHDWRKPRPGMLTQAAEDFRLDLTQSWMIGDMPRDIAAGLAAGCRTILLQDPENPSKANGSGGGEEAVPHYTVRTLADAARIISRDGRGIYRPSSQSPEVLPPASPPAIVETPAPVQAPPAAPASAPAPVRAPEPAPAPHVETHAAPPTPVRTDKLLEELVTQLRHQQRQHEYHGEFSLATFGAVILQFAAVSMMIIGVVSSLNSGSASTESQQVLAVSRAHTWILLGIGVQAMVIALIMMQRRR
jgi:histidinol phosphatase-like enzyme